MYLSKLKIIGFKSFANRINLDFNPGMSCIIGPNGSGKSNIVDAVRWVLGEQRTTALRSDKMENVIFNGTRKRKPTGMAEVALTIDNNRNVLNTEFKQVVITRRLYRSGESQYLINNTPVRLKDILDIFMDTGLGSNSYSVIELKMVESILSENKAERRLLLEEAAGVVKYKIRRKSALRKLDATRTDLTRLNDIIGEIQKNVNALSRQVGKARRYLKYMEELKTTEVDLARFRYRRLLDEIRPLKAQLSEASKLKEASHHQITIDEALLEDYKRELVKREQELQNLGKQLHDIDAQVSEMNRQDAVDQTKKEEITKNRSRYETEITEFKQKITYLQQNLAELEEELEELTQKQESVLEAFQSVSSERQTEMDKLQSEKSEIDTLNQQFREKLNRLSQVKENLRQKKYLIEFGQQQLNELHEKIEVYELANRDLQKARDRVATHQQELKTQISQGEEAATKLRSKQIELKNLLDERYDMRNATLAELESHRSRKQFFEQIISNYEGHSKSTQFVMNKRDSLSGIHGTLADILSADDKYALLLETILGDSLNYVLVDSLKHAKEIIDVVRREEKGRITLIPMDQIDALPDNPSIDANVDLLISHISTDEKFKKLVHILLGDVALANTLDDAVQLARSNPGIRVITLQGETVNFNREIAGGSVSKKSASVIGRKDQLKKYTELIASAEQKLSELELEIEQFKKEATRTEEALQAQSKMLEQKHNQLVDQEKQEHQLNFEVGKMQESRSQDEARIKQLSSEMDDNRKLVERLEADVERDKNDLDAIEKDTIQRTNAYETKAEALEILNQEVQQAQLEVSNLKNQVDNRKNDVARTKRNLQELQDSITRRQNDIKQIETTLIEIEQATERRKKEKITIWEKRDKLDSNRVEVERIFQERRDKIVELEDQTRAFRRQHDSSMETTRTLELKINENRYKAENLREHILKEHSEDIEIGIPYDDFDEQQAEETLETLHMRIKNLGPVNPLAVAEYDKEKERLDFLEQQRDDLIKAEASLLETISKINKTARKQFLDTFEAIKTNFEKVFKSFFANGEGTILMDEQIDPLEADIEIQVRTKGKRLQTLSLLSGGEKTLTAISLLFAIYLVKPSPFCILDEVDAPLDDINIGRFTQALKDFSHDTQFIVVTHNKRTMEAASTMYGVTMEEEGVSKIVSVKFS